MQTSRLPIYLNYLQIFIFFFYFLDNCVKIIEPSYVFFSYIIKCSNLENKIMIILSKNEICKIIRNSMFQIIFKFFTNSQYI